jgi:hypothetical protein
MQLIVDEEYYYMHPREGQTRYVYRGVIWVGKNLHRFELVEGGGLVHLDEDDVLIESYFRDGTLRIAPPVAVPTKLDLHQAQIADYWKTRKHWKSVDA